MAYITYEQYVADYGTPPISEEQFPTYAGMASDLIDSVTFYRIVEAGGLAALPSAIQTGVTKATAAQVMYFCEYGLEAVMAGMSGVGFTVGKVRVDGVNGGKAGSAAILAPMVRVYLEQTGLMRPAVDVCDGPRYSPWGGV